MRRTSAEGTGGEPEVSYQAVEGRVAVVGPQHSRRVDRREKLGWFAVAEGRPGPVQYLPALPCDSER